MDLFQLIESYRQMELGTVIGWYLSLLTGSILTTWLYNSTRGSIFALALFHATLDIASLSPAPAATVAVMSLLLVVWGLGVVVLAGPACLSRVGKQTAPLERGPFHRQE